MHAHAEMYDKVYLENDDYRMKPWRQKAVEQYLDGWAGRTMLDVGCGRGESLDIAARLGVRARGAEIAPCLTAREDIDLIEHGAASLPYTDGEFNVVMCLDVMEHIEEHEVDASMREMWRVARQRVLLGIACKISKNHLHCTQRAPEWWLHRIANAVPEATLTDVTGTFEIPKVKRPYAFFELSR